MLIINIIIFILFENVLNFYIPFGNHSNITLQNFSFGSCYGGFLADPNKSWIFKTINKNNPQMWVWGGDAAYLDSFSLNYFKNSLSLNFSHAVNMFNKTKNDQYYQTLYKNVPTIGVWDDHDYGFNDGNKYYKDKEYIKKLYLDFIDEPEDSLRRALNRGIFTSYTFGDNTTHKTVKIILLDVRFDKNSLVFDKSPDILGIITYNNKERNNGNGWKKNFLQTRHLLLLSLVLKFYLSIDSLQSLGMEIRDKDFFI